MRAIEAERFTFVLVRPTSDAQTIEQALEDEIGDRAIVAKPVADDTAARPAPKELLDEAPVASFAEADASEAPADVPLPVAPGPQIKTANIPLLGQVQCHKKANRALRGAMERLERNGDANLIDPETIVTCFEPQPTLMTIGHAGDHTTGLSVDIYVDDDGVVRPVDRRVRKMLEEFNFAWDSESAIHFEFVG